jgi:hypothetical protein
MSMSAIVRLPSALYRSVPWRGQGELHRAGGKPKAESTVAKVKLVAGRSRLVTLQPKAG